MIVPDNLGEIVDILETYGKVKQRVDHDTGRPVYILNASDDNTSFGVFWVGSPQELYQKVYASMDEVVDEI